MDRKALAAAWHEIGLRPGMVVLVHTALSKVGWIEGGPEVFARSLADAVSPGGTVLFPTLSDTGWASPERPPSFRVSDRPAPWVGRVPAAAMNLPGAVRSLHPTHSVAALGTDAEAIVAGHERCATPCAWDSPYGELVRRRGFVLLVGCDHESNTSLHLAEEFAGVPYHLLPGVAKCPVEAPNGARIAVRTRLHRWGVPRRFQRLDADLDHLGIQRRGRVGGAEARWIHAERLFAFAVWLLLANPRALLA
ncbi:MAG: AAC(3) family N-acetyltransferase [Fimbriimonadales bacterium]|nr:AAC(3) family N-acetyltransferase [Fimbriimonadales bacterium]